MLLEVRTNRNELILQMVLEVHAYHLSKVGLIITNSLFFTVKAQAYEATMFSVFTFSIFEPV